MASAAFFILLAVLVIRAETFFKDTQLKPAKLDLAVVIDEDGALQRFSKSLTYSTISYDDRSQFDAQEFLNFHHFLEKSYPLVHQNLERTVVNMPGESVEFFDATRFTTSVMMGGAAELLAVGTAVVIEPE